MCCRTYQAAHEDLSSGLLDWCSGSSGLGLPLLAGRLGYSADGSRWGRAARVGWPTATAGAASAGAAGLENVIEAGVKLGRHVDG
jgi:hypothetical protein